MRLELYRYSSGKESTLGILYLINDENNILVDSFNRKGILINIGEYYFLKPNEIDDLLNTIHSLGYKAYDEEINKSNIHNLGKEIISVNDINPGSGHNLICLNK